MTTYSEERETLRGTVAYYENAIAQAKDAGNHDVVDDLLEDALIAQAQLDELDDIIVEHLIPTTQPLTPQPTPIEV